MPATLEAPSTAPSTTAAARPRPANPLDLLRAKAARRSGGAKKPSAPVVECPEMASTLAAWTDVKRLVEQYTSQLQTLEAQISAAAHPARLAASRAAGQVVTTVKLASRAGSDGSRVQATVVQTSRYCKLPDETPDQQARVDELRTAFDKDFPRYFAEDLGVAVNEDAIPPEQFEEFLGGYVSLLMDHYGDDFDRYFRVTRSVAPTRLFHADYTLRPEVQAKADPFVADDTIRPYRPSIKV